MKWIDVIGLKEGKWMRENKEQNLVGKMNERKVKWKTGMENEWVKRKKNEKNGRENEWKKKERQQVGSERTISDRRNERKANMKEN